jgi:hypothetical protein
MSMNNTEVARPLTWSIAALSLALTLAGLAILRHRLYDIDAQAIIRAHNAGLR